MYRVGIYKAQYLNRFLMSDEHPLFTNIALNRSNFMFNLGGQQVVFMSVSYHSDLLFCMIYLTQCPPCYV